MHGFNLHANTFVSPMARDKPQAAAPDCQVALTHAELALHVLGQFRQTSGSLAWSVALIDQPPVIKKILAHLGLAAEALTKPEESIWRVRGPPGELFLLELDDAGLPVELDAIDEDPGEPFFDELPAEDWAA